MGFFSFLKRSSEKKEEVKEIKLEQLDEWADSLSKKTIEDANSKLSVLRTSITEQKNGVQKNLRILMNAELKNPSIPERVKQIREGNRTTYVQKVNLLLEQVSFPEELDKIVVFCNEFDTALSDFSSSTMKNYQVLQQFFENEVSSISVNIRTLDSLVKEVKKAVEDAGIEKHTELKNKVANVQKKIKQKQEIKEKTKLMEEELKKENEQIEKTQKILQELEQSKAYLKFNELVNEKQKLEQEIEELKNQLLHSFSVINTALKKYERLTLDDKLVRDYLKDFFKALLEDSQLKIAEVIDKMKASIEKGELELKDKKKVKILQELDKLNKTHFEEFLNKYSELDKKLTELSSEIEKEEVSREAEQLKSSLRQTNYRIEEAKHKLQQKTTEFEAIDIEQLRNNLEKDIKENIEEVKITL
ncbi:hypothetical protein CMO88_00830 [Candidatus Woesearchaeota archaeon]|nr:hypothetical protein [Candidatus Woesearchaeota archaeon]|tara:strand:+ start:1311 stop:2561 length:1251 start_codon:yes stop_codon:yes gene_type:complete